ncbi:MAG: hypothetical protein IT410_02200 [Candidatus Doudnabacteria bacterium]|nr:hypothetical protein [Candidatus Doudnabacteria bacterium]
MEERMKVFELHDTLDEGVLKKFTKWDHHDLALLSSADVTLINLCYRLVFRQVCVFLHYGHKPSKLAVDYAKIFASEGLIELRIRINSGDVFRGDKRVAGHKKIMDTLDEYLQSIDRTGHHDPSSKVPETTKLKTKRYEHCFVR